MSNGWIGCDLDGTLAEYEPGQFPEIGKPIPDMVNRIHQLMERGYEVKIFTARMSEQAESQRPLIEAWCEKHLGMVLDVTCVKHYDCLYFFDDRAKQVEPNTGKVLEDDFRVLNVHFTEKDADCTILKRRIRDLEFDMGALELAYTLVKRNLRELQDGKLGKE